MHEVVIPKPLGNKLYIQTAVLADRLKLSSLKNRKQSTPPSRHTFETVMAGLRTDRNPKNIAGMARFGISTRHTCGISVPVLRATAKEMGKKRLLAGKLWASGVHE